MIVKQYLAYHDQDIFYQNDLAKFILFTKLKPFLYSDQWLINSFSGVLVKGTFGAQRKCFGGYLSIPK